MPRSGPFAPNLSTFLADARHTHNSQRIPRGLKEAPLLTAPFPPILSHLLALARQTESRTVSALWLAGPRHPPACFCQHALASAHSHCYSPALFYPSTRFPSLTPPPVSLTYNARNRIRSYANTFHPPRKYLFPPPLSHCRQVPRDQETLVGGGGGQRP